MATIVFIVSIAVVVVMIGYKIIELNTDKKFKIPAKIAEGDRFIIEKINLLKGWSGAQKALVGHFILNHLPFHIQKFSAKIKLLWNKKYSKVKETIRGKYIIKEKGSVSLFLRNISRQREEHKED